MNRVKLFPLVLTIVFIGLTSLKTNSGSHVHSAKAGSWIFMWFEYDGCGDPFDPHSYWPIMFPPDCNAIFGDLCAIYAEADFSLFYPEEYGLHQLGLASAYFTQACHEWSGEVRLKE